MEEAEQITIKDEPGFRIEEVIDEFKVVTKRIEGMVPMYRTRVLKEINNFAFSQPRLLMEILGDSDTSSLEVAMNVHEDYLQQLKQIYL